MHIARLKKIIIRNNLFSIFLVHFHRIRGRLGSLLMLNVCIGILLGFIAGTHLPYNLVPQIFLPLPIVFFLLFIFFPETPQHYVMRKNFDVRKTGHHQHRFSMKKISNKNANKYSKKRMHECKNCAFTFILNSNIH